MASLAGAVQTALVRKKIPAFTTGSIHSLAQGIGMSFPVSIQHLLTVLNGLAPASVTFDSGALTAGFVHGSAYLFLQSDGGIAWGGHVHESGAIGDHFRFAVALLDVKDAAGNVLVFVHEDTVEGQLDIGPSDKNWNEPGINQLVADNWEQVRTTRIEFRLHVSTDVLQALETVFTIAPVVAGIVAGIVVGSIFLGAKACPEGSEWKCGYSSPGNQRSIPGDPREPPATGLEFGCRCEFD
jgi:hypothetical protein